MNPAAGCDTAVVSTLALVGLEEVAVETVGGRHELRAAANVGSGRRP